MNLQYNDCTRLLYINDVPFTKEAIEACKQVLDYNKTKKNRFSTVIGITDHVNHTTVTLTDEHLKTIFKYIKKNNLDLASDADLL